MIQQRISDEPTARVSDDKLKTLAEMSDNDAKGFGAWTLRDLARECIASRALLAQRDAEIAALKAER